MKNTADISADVAGLAAMMSTPYTNPDAAHAVMRGALSQISKGHHAYEEGLLIIAEAAQWLDAHIDAGGALPAAWSPAG